METMELTKEEIELVQSLRLKNKEKAKLWEPQRSLNSYSIEQKERMFDDFYQIALSELDRVKFKENTAKGERDVYFWFMKILGSNIFLDCINHIDLKGTN